MQYEIDLNKNAHINGSREAVLNRLVELGEQTDGAPQPGTVFEDAKDPTSPLHNEFVWNGDKAIEKLGMDRAQYLCRQLIMVTVNPVTDKVYQGPLVLNVAPLHHPAQNVSIPNSLDDPKYRQMMVNSLTNRLVKLREELEQYQEFTEVVIAIAALDIAA